MNCFLSDFGMVVRQAREEKGWTIQELADLAGLDERTVAKLEQGRGNPRFTSTVPIIQLLGIAPCTVFSEDSLEDKLRMSRAVSCMLELTSEQMKRVTKDALAIKKWRETNILPAEWEDGFS